MNVFRKPSSVLRLLSAIVCVAAIVAATACGRSSTRETKVQKATREQRLLLGNLDEPNDLDPAYIDSNITFNILMALMEGLAQYDPKTSVPVPAIAESWDISPDSMKWTFHLRPTAKWSNGDPVRAADFVYSFKRVLSPKLAAEYAQMLFVLKNGEAYYTGKISDFNQVGATAVDDHTLVLELDHPTAYLDKLVCHAIWYPVHQATIEKFGKIDDRSTKWTRPGNFVGNGPFILAEWTPNVVIRATKSPTYWNRDKVLLNEIDFLPIQSNTTEEAEFRTGGLHITATISPDKIPVYQNDPKLKGFLQQETQYCTYFFRFNVNKPPLNDVRVRRALSLAINKQEMIDRVTLGGQSPAGSLTPPDSAGFAAVQRFKYDVETARKLLAEAGYPGGAGFPRINLFYNTQEGHRKIAEALQQMWKKDLGIDISLSNVEGKVWAETMRIGDYEIGRMAWVGDYLDPSTFLDIMAGNSGNNQTGWKNAEYDRLLKQAGSTINEKERYAIYQRCEEILAEEAPIAPLYFYVRNNLRLPNVKGWYGNPLDLHPYTGVYLEP